MAMRLVRPTCDGVQTLEPRLLLCTQCLDHDGLVVAVHPAIVSKATAKTASKAAAASTTNSPLSALPLLHSNAGAPAKLFLDFDGAPATSWSGRSVPATPAFDQDGDPTTFSDAELAAIRQIVARVAEKYSPFNLDVTTEDPGQYLDRKALRVVIGGNGAWFGNAGGVAYVGGFYNSSSNTAWVFSSNLGNGNAKYVAEAAAHEAGHAFGLEHQSSYNSSGTRTAEYYAGNAQRAPIMGNSYDAARGLWWNGTSTSAKKIQDDLAILAGSNNGFGLRADDYADSLDQATPVNRSGLSFTMGGIITSTEDADVFSFSTGAGNVTITAAVATAGPMLDLKLAVYRPEGTLLGLADTASLGESLSLNLAAGTYLIVVASHGSYGDIGQYTLSGTVAAAQPVNVTRPTGLTATAATQAINLAWADNAGNETAYVVERSANGGATWTPLATLEADSTSYADTTAAAGVSYRYRVFAQSGAVLLEASNTAVAALDATTPGLAAPSGLTAVRRSPTRIGLRWQDNSNNEDGFRIEYSTDGVTWKVLGRVGRNVTSVDVAGLGSSSTWWFRVTAVNAGGNSDPSAPCRLGSAAAGLRAALKLTATPRLKRAA
jgi:hypothetical protein